MSTAFFKYLAAVNDETTEEAKQKQPKAEEFILPSANVMVKRFIVNATTKRGIGVLFGKLKGKTFLNVNRSYAIPFDEESTGSDVFYIDFDSVQAVMDTHAGIHKNETIIGWYHTGGKVCANDSKINELFANIIRTPIQLIFNPRCERAVQTMKLVVHRNNALNIDGINLLEPVTVLQSSILEDKRIQHGIDFILKKTGNQKPMDFTPDEQLKLIMNDYWKKIEDINEQIQKLRNKLPQANKALIAALLKSREEASVNLTTAAITRCIISVDDLIENRRKLGAIMKGERHGKKPVKTRNPSDAPTVTKN
uniref:JAB_MPN domain-containing protein n=1 Tax=Trichuris muris TaxID=70415 RepID=A0A5S6Q9K8_TRIMR